MGIKKNLIYFLVAFTVVLLTANIIMESSYNVVTEKEFPKISQKEIENKFIKVLDGFGIDSSWIKRTYVNKPLSDSLNYVWNVLLPKDVIIASVIKELNKTLITKHVQLESVEKKNYGNTILKIYSDNILKLYAKLNYSKKIKRTGSRYSFLVKTNFEDDDILMEILKNNGFPFAFLVTPSKEIKERLKEINNYAILIDNSIINTEYSLSEDYGKQHLINNVYSIVLDFGKDKLYLIDRFSEIYNSKIFNMLEAEFKKRGIKLHPIQKISKLKGENKNQLISLFRFYTKSLKGKEAKTFVIEFDDFITLLPEIEKQIRRGDKVVKVELN
jgi:hypothetical protein